MENILIIDDEANIRTILDRYLTGIGYEVRAVRTGMEGIELFNHNKRFDLVITDISMPGMDGNAVASHIRTSTKANIPIVAITGSGEECIKKELFDSVVIKPFKISTLASLIRSLL